MKKYRFNDGSVITASTAEEAKAKHKIVSGYKSLNLDDLEEALDYEYDIDDDYSNKEITKINKFLASKDGKVLVSNIKKEYATYKKIAKKFFDEIEKAKKPVSSKVSELKKILSKLLDGSNESYLRQDVSSLFKKVATKVGIKDFKIKSVDYREEDDETYVYYEIDFKSKQGKKVHIEFEVEEGYYDGHEYNKRKDPIISINKITFNSSKVNSEDYVDTFTKSTINEQKDTLEYLYNDLYIK